MFPHLAMIFQHVFVKVLATYQCLTDIALLRHPPQSFASLDRIIVLDLDVSLEVPLVVRLVIATLAVKSSLVFPLSRPSLGPLVQDGGGVMGVSQAMFPQCRDLPGQEIAALALAGKPPLICPPCHPRRRRLGGDSLHFL